MRTVADNAGLGRTVLKAHFQNDVGYAATDVPEPGEKKAENEKPKM